MMVEAATLTELFGPPKTTVVFDARLAVDPTIHLLDPPSTLPVIDKRLPINPIENGDPFAGIYDPFAGFDFEVTVAAPEKVAAPPIDFTELSNIWNTRKKDVVVAMASLTAAAAANCACPPQQLSDGRIVHGVPITLFKADKPNYGPIHNFEAPAGMDPTETQQGLLVTTGCKPEYVHVYQPDGSYKEIREEEARRLFTALYRETEKSEEINASRPATESAGAIMKKLGFSEKEMGSWAAAMSMGGIQIGGHIESGCCTPSSAVSIDSGGVSASSYSIGGGGGGHSHSSSESHSDHEHCSCGGHIENGTCEKCGKALVKNST